MKKILIAMMMVMVACGIALGQETMSPKCKFVQNPTKELKYEPHKGEPARSLIVGDYVDVVFSQGEVWGCYECVARIIFTGIEGRSASFTVVVGVNWPEWGYSYHIRTEGIENKPTSVSPWHRIGKFRVMKANFSALFQPNTGGRDSVGLKRHADSK